jgi:N-acetyl-gamma-glutamyl-phosphate reductase
MHKIPVGILGASGYAGRELSALVARHPHLELRFAAAHGQAGDTVRLPGGGTVTFSHADDAPLGDVALVFTALPHGASASWVARAREAGAKVVDLANDMRPGSGEASLMPSGAVLERAGAGSQEPGGAAAVGHEGHRLPAAGSRSAATAALPVPYGLTEVTRAQVAGADVVANPGCYPTAILLALLPLLEQGMVAEGATIVADAASGVTGAGISPKVDLLYGEVTENYKAYGVGNGHKHLDELRAVVADAGADVDLLFTPHLLPVARGILATITVPLARPLGPSAGDVLAPWRERWSGERFVEVADAQPTLRDVVGRNVCRIHAVAARNLRRPTLVITSAIDNLLKGAAGQALQNANLMLGLDEAAGLPA